MITRCFVLLAVLLVNGISAKAETFTLLRVSRPLIVSGAAGLRMGSEEGRLSPAVQVEAGIGGGKLAVGMDHTGRGNVGYSIKAGLLRTWIAPLGVDEAQTFMGPEVEFSVKQLVFSLGGYRRISDGDDDWLASAGIGFIF